MPRIDPLKLLICLSGLLAPNGGIRGSNDVKRLTGLMGKFCKKLVSKCIYIQILKCTETELLGEFMSAGGWTLAYTWLSDGIQSKNWPLVQEILELMLLCPVDVQRLKINSAPKLVKQLSKEGGVEAVRILASKLVEQWLKIVKGETMTEIVPGVAAPSTSDGCAAAAAAAVVSGGSAIAAVDGAVPMVSVAGHHSNNVDTIESNNTTIVTITTNNNTTTTTTTFPTSSPQFPTHPNSDSGGLVYVPQQHQHVVGDSNAADDGGDEDDEEEVDDDEEAEEDEDAEEENEDDGEETTPAATPTENNGDKPADLVYKITLKDGKQVLAKVETTPKKSAIAIASSASPVVGGKGLTNTSDNNMPKGSGRRDGGADEDDVDANASDAALVAANDVVGETVDDTKTSAGPEAERRDRDKSKSSKTSGGDKDKSSSSSSGDRQKDRKTTSTSSSSSSKRSHGSSSSSSSHHRSSSSSNSNHKTSSSSSSRSGRDDKDRHRSGGSSKSSSSSSSTSASQRDKSRDKSSTAAQAEKDKETLHKVLAPTSLGKLGKIPKKPRDASAPAAGAADSATATVVAKKPSISIEVRNKDVENRPKTVKTFNSKFRSHGLAEEAPPPPSRRGIKKPNPSPSAPGTVIPSSSSAERLAGTAKRRSVSPQHDAEKKPKLDMSVAANHVDKPGAIKLISPKPKPSVLMESDMFMDALFAATTSKKDASRKRKRRPSLTKDSPSATTAANTSNSSDPSTSPTAAKLEKRTSVEDPDTAGTEVQSPPVANASDEAVKLPTVAAATTTTSEPEPEPEPPVAAPMKFYQDTLETRRSTTPEPSKTSEDGADDKQTSTTTSADDQPTGDDDDRSAAAAEATARVADDADSDTAAADPANNKKSSAVASESASTPAADATPDDTPASSKLPGPGCGPNGPPGVLIVHRRKGPKKQLRWRPAEQLEEVRFFELDENERCNVTKTPQSFGDMKQIERSNERDGFAMARKLTGDDHMTEQMAWSTFLFEVEDVVDHPNGAQSKERELQQQRELSTLKALYFNRLMVPDNPAEPDFEMPPAGSLGVEPLVIPLDDVTGNLDAVNDFTGTVWPEPRGSPPPPPMQHHMKAAAVAVMPGGGVGPMPMMDGGAAMQLQHQQQHHHHPHHPHHQMPPGMMGGGGVPVPMAGGYGGQQPMGVGGPYGGGYGGPNGVVGPGQTWNGNGMMDGPPPGFGGGMMPPGMMPPNGGGPPMMPPMNGGMVVGAGHPPPGQFGPGQQPFGGMQQQQQQHQQQFGGPNGFAERGGGGDQWMRRNNGPPGNNNWRGGGHHMGGGGGGPPPGRGGGGGGGSRPPWLNRTRLCKSHAKGFCRNGDACNFLHPGLNGPRF